MKSNYEIISNKFGRVVIKDIGPWDKFFTVTNNAENVVIELVQKGVLKPGNRLFYFDSVGDLSEIKIVGDKFCRFESFDGPKKGQLD
jgi:hypothetical protein